MKAFIALTIALSFHMAHANDDINLASCAAVTPIAVLAKDNMPFWSESQDLKEKISCYNALKSFAQDATATEIADLEEAFDGQVRILMNDADYAAFIQDNKVQSDFIVEASNDTMTPVYKHKAVFFQASH